MSNFQGLKSSCLCDECGQKTNAEPSRYHGEEKTLCDDCDGEYVYCFCCEDNIAGDSLCRHLFWSDTWGCYGGCGYDHNDWDSHKESFFALLGKIGIDAAKALLVALKQHRYFHQFSGTILGCNQLAADWWDDLGNCKDYGDLFTKSLLEEEEESMAVGVQWLVSLWAGIGYSKEEDDGGLAKTPDADNHTAQWVEEWIKQAEALSNEKL